MKQKRLAIFRHGPVSTQNLVRRDHDKTLSQDASLAIGHSLNVLSGVQNFVPQVVLSSDAKRCLQTLEHVEKHYSEQLIIEIRPQFYQARCQDIFDALMVLDEAFVSVMLLGHNPAWSQMISELSGHYINLPPAGLAVLARENSYLWSEASTTSSWELQGSNLPGLGC